MAGRGSAEKRNRQNEKRRIRNKSIKSEVRTSIKKFHTALAEKNKDQADQYLKDVEKKIDSAAGKGIYHKNNAARKKQRLYKKLHAAK
ncbi:MAG: 30S ribosomal protein S20 [Spirochaetia bacterium]